MGRLASLILIPQFDAPLIIRLALSAFLQVVAIEASSLAGVAQRLADHNGTYSPLARPHRTPPRPAARVLARPSRASRVSPASSHAQRCLRPVPAGYGEVVQVLHATVEDCDVSPSSRTSYRHSALHVYPEPYSGYGFEYTLYIV